LAFETLEPRVVLNGTSLVINEFMAQNDSTLADEDGDFSDWIEIHNPTDQAVDLAGWHLTDDAGELAKWEFPARTILPGEHLLVFASDKNRTDPDAELHTNFKLSGGGEYLGLIEPDGVTVVHQYSPEYPNQSADVAYGISQSISSVLLGEGAELGYHVPRAADVSLADTWTAPDFDDALWNPIEKKSPLLITEVGTEDPDFVEIQNVTANAIDTAGWVVAVNDGVRANVNAMHSLWELPEWIGAEEVLYRHDDTSDPEHYWGELISWRTVGTGWVIVVDADGGVVDAVVWGYPASYLEDLNVTINGQTITADDVWGGAAVTAAGTSSNSLQRYGDGDDDTASDWHYVVPPSQGNTNAALAVPFDMPGPPTTGVGFSTADPAALDDAIQTDVGMEMHGQNASLWTRIPFEVADPSEWDSLSLHLKYNDGFVAYLNGERVAARSAPDVPQWNSTATFARSISESLLYEEINVSSFRGHLQPGRNVLSIHGLNHSVSDATFLLSPKITATSYRKAEQFFTSATPGEPNSAGFIVINEVHYDPADKTQPAEFIELYNTTDDTIDLSGWRFDNGVRYTFPEGTTLRGGRYLVVAENPATVKSLYGVDALGPWVGRLDNDGERIELLDELEHVQDEVRYKSEFPWPIASRGGGSSMELIDPALDNDLGGSWRPSGYDTLTVPGAVISPANAKPTPGRRNSVDSQQAPPQIRQVVHAPQQPTSNQPVTVTAKIADPQGVAGVTLAYQLVEPGDYIEIGDPRFNHPGSWTAVAMNDNGAGGDLEAGDDVYTAVLPGGLQVHRRLVRYRITAEDTAGASITAPHMDDTQPNFAYYVYDAMPDWTGAVRAGQPEVTYDNELLESVAVYQLITTRTDHERSQSIPNSNAGQDWSNLYKYQGTLVYDGEVYDHIRYRPRGGVHRFKMGKNMWKFDFNTGHYFQAYDDYGRPYDVKWDKMNFSAIIQQGNFNHRGEQGLFEAVGFEMFDLTGVEGPNTNYIHFRIVEYADQRGPNGAASNQYSSDFQGVYLVIEQPDGRLLEQHGLPDGNFYKMEKQGGTPTGELNNQGPTQPTNKQDLNAFLSGYGRNPSEAWWRANLDLGRYYSYRAIVEGIHHYDIANGKNYFYYHNPETELWSVHPWDLDLTWANNMYGNGNEAFRAAGVLNHPAIAQEYRNRMREIRDLLYNTEQTGMLIDEKASFVYTPGEPSLVDADRAMWDYNPIMSSSYINTSKTRPGWFYQIAPTKDFPGMAKILKNYVVSRGNWIRSTILTDESQIPKTPTLTYTGDAEFAVDQLTFRTSAYQSPQNTPFEAMRWRIAEVTDPTAEDFDPTQPRHYEMTATWQSDDFTSFSDSIQVPGGALDVGHTYRVRVQMKDTSGRWSHWSDPVQLTAAAPLAPAGAGLIVSELMYHPPDPTAAELAIDPFFVADDFEFIELQNTSDVPVDLTGFEFSDGVEFDFAANSPPLAPGQYAVLARDLTAFAARYGDAIQPLGVFAGGLNNGGEGITLAGPHGNAVVEFTYNDAGGWSGRADGKGASLVAIDPAGELADPDNWRASAQFGGTPGADPAPDPGVVISEVLTRTDSPLVDAIELHNPTDAPIDVGGWYLSDDWGFAGNPRNDDYQKFRIPDGTVIPAGGFAPFYEGHYEGDVLVADPATEFGGAGVRDFALNGVQGDDVWLTTADAAGNLTGFADHIEFPAAIAGESFGRVDDTGKLAPMIETTLGEPNAAPRIGPVVITEVMYQQGDDEVEGWTALEDSLEFIELHNASDAAVPLFDPADSTQTWRFTNVGFGFPEGVEMLPGETLLVVPGEPDDFELKYEVAPGVRVLGPYTGVLDNSGERLRLMRPVPPSPLVPHVVPYVIADQVDYEPDGAWPATAPQGQPPLPATSLQREVSDAWGNDPIVWTAGEPTPGSVPWAAAIPRVVGRHLFYNNSTFDGNDPAAGAADDAAIAVDKQALLPGEVATFANYTSYGPGINGVMIDVAGATGAITSDAFALRVGQGAPAAWDAAPSPTSFFVRPGEGVGGSDRVTLIWGDHAIRNRWLEVFVIGAPLGLAADDVFYFGSAVAESGNSPLDAQVTTTDLLLARNNPRNFLTPAPVDFAFDYNRDARVNTTDVLLARNNQTNFLTRLPLLDLSGGAGAAELAWVAQLDEEVTTSWPEDGPLPAAEAVDALLGDE